MIQYSFHRYTCGICTVPILYRKGWKSKGKREIYGNAELIRVSIEKLSHFRSLPLEGKVSADRLTDEVDGTAQLTTSSTASARNMPPACFNLPLRGRAFSFVSIIQCFPKRPFWSTFDRGIIANRQRKSNTWYRVALALRRQKDFLYIASKRYSCNVEHTVEVPNYIARHDERFEICPLAS